jgi:hypothetical protein
MRLREVSAAHYANRRRTRHLLVGGSVNSIFYVVCCCYIHKECLNYRSALKYVFFIKH